MAGAGTRSVTNASGIGWAPSSAESYVAVVHIAGRLAPLSYSVHFGRHMSRVASPVAIGIRGATPPPTG